MDLSAPPLRVLVVDDDRDTADTVALLLRLWGHEPVVAYDAAAALSAARAALPDAAVLDLGLPATDGYELARRLRALPGAAGVLLVALTGYGGEAHARRALAAGFDRYLVKPACPDDLLEALAGACRRRRPLPGAVRTPLLPA